jgi:hypothetical protein
MIVLSVASKGAFKPRVYETCANRSLTFKSCQPLIVKRTRLIRAQDSKEDNQSLESSKELDATRAQLPKTNIPASAPPPPPRRRSPVGRELEEDKEEEQERDIFIPVMVVLALVGYGATAVIAWLEYEGIFTF